VHRSLNWQRHWKLMAAAAAIVALFILVLGGIRVAAVTSGDGGGDAELQGAEIAGTVDLFDPSVVHTIEVTFEPADYEAAIETFTQDGEKEYLEADAVIDGTLVESVGIRLKGNSTLFGLAGSAQAGGDRAVGGVGNGLGGSASAESPEDLPWLIRFDEFVDGRTYQGQEEVAVRPGGMGIAQTTALNEVLSLTLIALAGEPAEEASYTAFSVNGSEPTLRLLVQHPDDSFAEDDFENEGVLYKALSGTDGGSFSYEGEDPLAYEGSFRQVTRQNQQDLAPLIEFIQWVEGSSDEEFSAGLAERVDVESLARYLALHNLLLDSDDMSGPGQNYYLFYDLETERFTVVTWDVNATFTGDSGRGPYDNGTMGGQGGVLRPQEGEVPGGGEWPQGRLPGGLEPPEGFTRPQQPQPGELPEGVTPPEGMEPPAGFQPPTDGGATEAGQVPGGMVQPPGGQVNPGSGMGGHLLKERFLEVPEFQALYEETYRDLYDQLFAGAAALAALDRWAEVLSSVEGDLTDAATLADEVAQLRQAIEARTEALASNEVITG